MARITRAMQMEIICVLADEYEMQYLREMSEHVQAGVMAWMV